MSLPLELVDRYVGSDVWIVMKNDQEFSGKLLGFDDFMNVVLESATEHNATGVTRELPQLLLHGRNVAMIIPGGVEAPGAPTPAKTEVV